MSDRQPSAVATNVETLEARQLLSVNVAGIRDGRLIILGTDKPEEIRITINPQDASKIDVDVIGKPTRSFDRARVTRLHIDARGGDDVVDVQKNLDLNAYVEGGFGDDTVYGGAGKNIVLGEKGDDLLIGNEQRDLLDGGIGNDALRGEGNNDRLVGGAGDDQLDGGPGDDALLGTAGADLLVGGDGEDRCVGGGGADTFEGDDDDEIFDFTTAKTHVGKFGKKTSIPGDVLN